ncbi:hypothetical protein [Motiliproteus sp. SC1-56]|uniref:hypothetical protein n=1 Tax=Motiliproteus sp. SC1-56 TaxID=2799565 RepID=UPI001A8DC302|nr:hypothetical protein [Motiliproteus sp. SC1-56]
MLLVAACSDSDSDSPAPLSEGGPPAGEGRPAPLSDDPVENTLLTLGVPLEDRASPAIDGDGNPLPSSFEPLGAVFEVSKPAELLFAGGAFETRTEQGAIVERVPDPDADSEVDPDARVTSLLHNPPERFWLTSGYSEPYSAIGADIDSDGLEETVVVYVDENGELRAYLIDDGESGFAESGELVAPGGITGTIHAVDLAAGDFDNDQTVDVALAVGTQEGLGFLVILTDEAGQLATVPALTRLYASAGNPLRLFVSAGNNDYDNASELALTRIDEDIDPSLGKAGSGVVHLEVLDVEEGAWGLDFEVDNVTIDVELSGDDTPEQMSAIFGVGVLVDIDADQLDELAFAGLNAFLPDVTGDLDNADPRKKTFYILVAHEDGEGGYQPIATARREFNFEDSLETARQVRFIHVNPVDLDGDERLELQVNEVIFDNFADTPEPWEAYCAIAPNVFLPDDSDFPLAPNNTATAIGDFNADGTSNMAYLVPTGAFVETIKIYGEGCIVEDEIPVEPLSTASNNDVKGTLNYVNLQLAAVNVDDDAIILRSVPGQHFVSYTEPMIVAALAAPPCAFDIGQSIDACSTSFGSTSFIDLEASASMTVFGSMVFGVEVDGGVSQTEASAKTKLSAYLSAGKGWGFTRSESVVFTSGAMEDTVIFSTVPYDVFEMVYVRFAQRPDLVGRVARLLLPRPPLTLMVEKEFFNASVPEEDRIGSDVFQHTIGDLDSYPTVAERDQLMRENAFVLDLVDGFIPWVPPARTQSAVHVGEGGGNVQLGLAIGQSVSSSVNAGLSLELDVEVTAAGVVGGYSVGVGAEVGFSKSYGEEMSYTGTIGNLDAVNFADSGYAFGLFTYHQQRANGDTFEVINYWVEPD